ncbi:PH domain-containing protein [Microbacterium sulfonylureivorans]|uniref:PH domain-containing protein n=1 Tax=Microbacterium sulfonylureivorans TaxID=2486854 RepID=UPI000FD7775F|nr:PH domain-containing protein [Microbacterium sulfonylureivorans]
MSLFDPRIDKHLIADQGEVVIDEVHKHWAAVVVATLELFGGVVLLLLVFFVPAQAWWVPVLLGGAICLHAGWRILERRTDIFVITNMRVFRVHGILSRSIATMPLARILDISVHKPILGRVFGYGHFVFESAAQAQGLREIRYVGDPDGRGLTIQRVIQQAGLRGFVANQPMTSVDARRSIPPAPPLPSGHDRDSPWAQTAQLRPERSPEQTSTDAETAGMGWDWLAVAQRREQERLAHLRCDPEPEESPPFDPDRTSTAPIDLPR